MIWIKEIFFYFLEPWIFDSFLNRFMENSERYHGLKESRHNTRKTIITRTPLGSYNIYYVNQELEVDLGL